MTIIKIFKKQGRITAITASGHTDFGEEGSDILCASISSIIQTAALGIKELVTKDVILKCDNDIPLYSIVMPDNLPEKKYSDADLILKTCMLGLKDLADGYHKFIKMEVKNDVY